MRPRRAAVPHRLLPGLAPALLLVACGQDPATVGDAPTPGPAAPPSEPAATPADPAPSPTDPATAADLTVTWDDGVGGAATWTLRCGPGGGTGGDHPDADAACAALAGEQQDLDPVPRDVVCTEVYGGPQTATVDGTLGGSPVAARLSRTNGCEIARWDSLVPLLPAAVQGT